MATKQELAVERDSYLLLLHNCNESLASNDVRTALRFAVNSLPHVNGAFQYERRFEKNEDFHFSTHLMIFNHAPSLFAFPALDAVESQLEDAKYMLKNASIDFFALLADARSEMRYASKLWTVLSATGIATKRDSPSQSVLDKWERYGCIIQRNDLYQPVTDLEEKIRAKCWYCGSVLFGRKRKLLQEAPCPKCSAISVPTLLDSGGKGE